MTEPVANGEKPFRSLRYITLLRDGVRAAE
jgi:hypothetical protein